MRTAWLHINAFLVRVHCFFSQFFTGFGGDPLPHFETIGAIHEALGLGERYKPDRRIGALVHPNKVQARLLRDKLIGDCEDHAGFWCKALLHSFLSREVYMGLVYYRDTNGKRSGHAVCVFSRHGEYYWSDYRLVRTLASRDAWITDVAKRFSPNASYTSGVLFRVSADGIRGQLRLREPRVYGLPKR